MPEIKLCIIGRKTDFFTTQLNTIKNIKGLKVQKRRNKPFYDVVGAINAGDIATMTAALANLLNSDAELEIEDKALQDEIIALVKPLVE